MGKGSEFLRYCVPIIDVLRKMGGSGTAAEVTDAVIEKLQIPESEQIITLKNGESRVRNQIAWARFYLTRAGYLESSERGVWSLTEKGLSAKLSDEDLLSLLKEVQKSLPKKSKKSRTDAPVDSVTQIAPPESEASNYKDQLLQLLMSLTPSAFERVCQRLLREAGFAEVTVTGKSGDGGLDGHGILQLNAFVTFRVMFQCKRYQGTVTPSQVRDFRGAMLGRADKGIIITTGSFTTEAIKEARRDGVPPIELVDGDKLISMFETLELGLKPKKTFEVDRDFFSKFL